ncbi:MAG: hypothetical protein K2Q26_03490 [Bdellovibrionales bacterium]|nr:hypothetical protein [Bdellovibrionales bacterium]
MKAEILARASSFLPKRNLDESKDIRLLHELMPNLSDEKVLAVYFRFWERLLIDEIAKILGLTWDEADKLIDSAILELREGFLTKQAAEQKVAA